MTQIGPQKITGAPTYSAIAKPAIDKALSDIDGIISNKHFIEEN